MPCWYCCLRSCFSGQITHEFQRFGTFIDGFRVSNYIGGMAARGKVQKDQVKEDAPKIVVGTPGRIKAVSNFLS